MSEQTGSRVLSNRQLYQDAFKFTGIHILQTFPLLIIPYLLIFLFFFFYPLPANLYLMSGLQFCISVFVILISVWFNAAMILAVGQAVEGQPFSILPALWSVIPRIPVLYLTTLLISLFIVMGLFLYFVPGFIVAWLMTLYVPFIMLEKTGVLGAIKGSVVLVWRHLFHVGMFWIGLFILGSILNLILMITGVHMKTVIDFSIIGLTYFIYLILFFPTLIAMLYVELKKNQA